MKSLKLSCLLLAWSLTASAQFLSIGTFGPSQPGIAGLPHNRWPVDDPVTNRAFISNVAPGYKNQFLAIICTIPLAEAGTPINNSCLEVPGAEPVSGCVLDVQTYATLQTGYHPHEPFFANSFYRQPIVDEIGTSDLITDVNGKVVMTVDFPMSAGWMTIQTSPNALCVPMAPIDPSDPTGTNSATGINVWSGYDQLNQNPTSLGEGLTDYILYPVLDQTPPLDAGHDRVLSVKSTYTFEVQRALHQASQTYQDQTIKFRGTQPDRMQLIRCSLPSGGALDNLSPGVTNWVFTTGTGVASIGDYTGDTFGTIATQPTKVQERHEVGVSCDIRNPESPQNPEGDKPEFNYYVLLYALQQQGCSTGILDPNGVPIFEMSTLRKNKRWSDFSSVHIDCGEIFFAGQR